MYSLMTMVLELDFPRASLIVQMGFGFPKVYFFFFFGVSEVQSCTKRGTIINILGIN